MRSFWVLSAADGKYQLGQFDGHKFTPETAKLTLWHGDFYAAQTFTNTSDGRRIQIGWARGIDFPGMPFNQQMTFPSELTLRTTPDGPRLHAEPVAEMARSHVGGEVWNGFGSRPQANASPETRILLDTARGIDLTVDFAGDVPGGVVVSWLGSDVDYDPDKQVVRVAGLEVPLKYGRFEPPSPPLKPLSPREKPRHFGAAATFLRLRILGDRRSLEVFGNGGQVAISRRITPNPDVPALRLTTQPHPIQSRSVTLRSTPIPEIWPGTR